MRICTTSFIGVGPYKLYACIDMSQKRKRDKDLDGTNEGNFDELNVSGNGLIQGNLTVVGTINGGGGGSTNAYYQATDATNQFRTTATNLDLKANSATPTFSFKNSSNATTSSTLVTGGVTVQNGAWTSNGNDIFLSANASGIYLRPTAGSANGELENSTTITGVRDAGGTSIWSVDKTTDNVTQSGQLIVTNTTQSTNSSTGAIITDGGIGVAKNIHAGNQIHAQGNTQSTSTTTGTLISSGGLGVALDANVGGRATTGGVTSSGTVLVTNATASTTPTTGAVQVTGGMGVQGNINSGGVVAATAVFASGAMTNGTLVSSGNIQGLSLTSTAETTVGGTATVNGGALIFGGDTVIRHNTADGADTRFTSFTGGGDIGPTRGGRVIVSGNERATNAGNVQILAGGSGSIVMGTNGDTTRATIDSTGLLTTTGSAVLGGSLTISSTGGTYQAGSIFGNSAWGMIFRSSRLAPSNEDFLFANSADTHLVYLSQGRVRLLTQTAASTSSTTGGLQIPGGLAISNTTNAVSPTNGGGITCAGGVAIARDVRVGGILYVQNGSWTSNGNDVIISANTSGMYLRPTTGSGNGEFEHLTTVTRVRDASANVIWTIDKTANTVTQSGPQIITNNTQATSTTTGALRVTGGMSCQGNLHVGGTITGGSVSYGSTTSGTFTVTNGTGQTFVVDSTEVCSSPTTGAARIKGGLGVEGDLNVGGTITGGSISYGSTSTGTLAVTNGSGVSLTVASTTDSTSSSTGAVVLEGGLGIKDTADSTSATNGGAMTVAGGAAITKTLRVGGNFVVQNTSWVSSGNDVVIQANANSIYLRPTSFSGNGEFQHSPTASIFRDTLTNAIWTIDKSANTVSQTGPLIITNTTSSTGPSTGALRVTGGISTQENLNVNGNGIFGGNVTASLITAGNGLNVTGTVNLLSGTGQRLVVSSTELASSTTTGSVRLNGGMGVGGNIVAAQEIGVNTPSPAKAELSVYNQGSVAEWAMGQRSGSDHEFTISSRVSGVYTERARINLSGQMKLGSGAFFGYNEGTWTPEVRAIDSGGGGAVYTPFGLSYTTQTGFYTVVGKTVTLTYQLNFSYTGVSGPSSQYCIIRGIPANLALTTQTEVTQSCFRGTFAGITNPFYSTIWQNGYTLPSVTSFDGQTMTIGVYNSGNYLTGAFQLLGATNQQMWGTFTYTIA